MYSHLLPTTGETFATLAEEADDHYPWILLCAEGKKLLSQKFLEDEHSASL